MSLLLVLSGLCKAWADVSGGVHGQVVMPNGVDPSRLAVVWLDAPGLHAEPMQRAVIDQRNKTFMPHVLVVTPGTKIQFPNNDTVFHNVFAYFEAKRFDLGMYPRGSAKAETFDHPGVVALLCNIHPQMSAFIVVVNTPYYAITDRNGHFDVGGMPPGAYMLHAWHESGASYSAKFTVSDANAATTQRLTLTRN